MAYSGDKLILGTLAAASSGYTGATYQYRVVTLSSATTFKVQTSSTQFALGILQDTPAIGQAGQIVVSGVTKARVLSTASKAIVVGDKLKASTAGGVMASTGAATKWYVLGHALTALSSGTTGIISMLITHQGLPTTGVKGTF
jgi:hypothetical protein